VFFCQRTIAIRLCARFLGFALVLSLLVLSLTAVARAAASAKTVTYHGYSLRVPRHWPVYNLVAHPATCVRFNRHAVYLGTPGPNQSCPDSAIGRTEAILIGPAASEAKAALSGAGVTRRVRRGVAVTATWNHSPAVIEQALGFRSLRAMSASAPPAPAPAPGATQSARAHTVRAAAAGGSTPGQVFTGYGFDACSTPSAATMSAWGSSPYRAIGVYIGGTNAACAQPNLTSAWVQQESAAGWHVIPIYVGLQAPGGCCQAISSSSAASEGTQEAQDAVAEAGAYGLGPGNPIYFDMEAYTRSTSTTNTVLTFLAAWTNQLHASGYLSGVYVNLNSGVPDLVSRWGTSYPEPDDIWYASWSCSCHSMSATTTTSSIPSTEWANHQRLHQYTGSHNETYPAGGVTLNIDQNYLDGATAAYGSGAVTASATPTDLSPPLIAGNAYAGQTLTEHHGAWSGGATSYSYQWYRCSSSGSSCAPISGANTQSYVVGPSDVGSNIEVSETAANTAGSSTPAYSAQTHTVLPAPTSSYWLYTAYGNVYNALGAPFYGSAAKAQLSSVSGMAATLDGKGYWLVDSAGKVFNYGDAKPSSGVQPAHPIIGMVAAPGGGSYLFTAYGNVYNLGGAHFRGSPRHSHVQVSTITGMAVTHDGGGYWLVDAAGQAFHYGDAGAISAPKPAYPVEGVSAAPGGGIWEWTSYGNIYNLGGAPFYGSPYHEGYRNPTFRGLALTKTGHGYWMTESGGLVLPFGDAEGLPGITPKHPLIGIQG
jgi:hypothetical protein